MFYGGTVPISVSNIDSSCISNDPSVQTSLALMDDTLNPPLTPTTLNSLEQTFMELQQPISTMANTTYTTDSFMHNVPPPTATTAVDSFAQNPTVVIKTEPVFEENTGYSPSEQMAFEGERQSSDNFVVPNIDPVTYLVANSRRPTGPRRKRNLDILSNEELEKLGQRREKNRMAAAKCRMKRDNHTMRLVHETEQLEEEQANLETEIQNLQQQKEQLEFLLSSHMNNCNLTVGSSNGLSLPASYNPSCMETTQISQQQQTVYPNQTNMSFQSNSNNLPTTTTQISQMNQYSNYNTTGNSSGNVFQFTGNNSVPTTTCSSQLRRYSLERSLSNGLMSPKLMC